MADSDKTIRVVRIFVSSPGDVQEERKVLDEVITRINSSTEVRERGVRLEVWKWEDAVPQIGPQPQTVIDPQTPGYDIYFGIMAHRFGTPTGKYQSGTEQEFMAAFEQWGEIGKPWILFYFNEAPVNPATLDMKQYPKVCKFRDRVQQHGLYAKYDSVRGSDTAFFEQVELHLRNVIPLILAGLTDEAGEKRAAEKQPVPSRVFISHSALDREFVEREIVSLLTRHGIKVWYSQQDIRTASQWQRSIQDGLDECDLFLVVLSRRSVDSRWVRAEVH